MIKLRPNYSYFYNHKPGLITNCMTIQTAIEQLQNYQGPDNLTLHPAADEARLQAVERIYNITLPDDFKEFYRFSDGFETDEDIFNMIPLIAIIQYKDKKNSARFYIAEYMIYSDMWQLEINPDNSNDYKIFIEANYNKIVLTTSLAEFIDRFLKGGVFGPGGLYEWQQEVELQPIYTTQLKAAEFLLTAFCFGIKNGLVSTKEIKDWAGRIVLHEDEPEHFFIELSLSSDKDEMLSLLNTVSVPESNVAARGILGLLYHRLSAGDVTATEALTIMDKLDSINLLTQTEINYIHRFTNKLRLKDPVSDSPALSESLLDFLAHYKEFEITNFKNWFALSLHIEYKFTDEGKNSINKQVANRHLSWITKTIQILALASFLIVTTTYNNVAGKTPLSKFRMDLYQLASLYLLLFMLFCILRVILWLVARLQKM